LTNTPFRERSSSTRRPSGWRTNQRVAARDGGIVEADVSREAAPDPGPLADEREGDDLVARAVGDVLTRLVQAAAQFPEPAPVLDLGCKLDDRLLRGW